MRESGESNRCLPGTAHSGFIGAVLLANLAPKNEKPTMTRGFSNVP
jgi:hypothetical protein